MKIPKLNIPANVKIEIPPLPSKRLDAETIAIFSKVQLWSIQEAVMLSIGYQPTGVSDRVPEYERHELVSAVKNRIEFIFADISADDQSSPPREFTIKIGTDTYFVDPGKFVTSLKREGLFCNDELFKAVVAHHKPKKISGQKSLEQPSPPQKGKNGFVDFRNEIAAYALEFEYKKGCTCCHTKLAAYLMALRKDDKALRFPPPPKDTKRYHKQNTPMIKVFTEAAKAARKASGLKIKGGGGFKDTGCKRHPQIK